MQDRIFYSVCFGFAFGVLLRSFIFVNFYFIILLAVIACALFLFFSFVSKNSWGVIASVFILVFSLGIMRFHMVDSSVSNSAGILADRVGQKVTFTGEIVDDPDIREVNQKLIIEVEREQYKTKILLSTSLDQDYEYGDEISFEGRLEKPENFITDQ